MRKIGLVIGLVGAVLSSKVYASELPDFREYVKGNRFHGTHFTLIPLDERRSLVARGGYIYITGRLKGTYCRGYGLSVYTKVSVGGMEVEKEYPKDIGSWGLTFGKDSDFHHTGYCKDKEGNVVVSYRGYIVEHPPSKSNEVLLPLVAEKRVEKVKGFEDMLKEFKAKRVEGDIYMIEEYFTWSKPPHTSGDDDFNPFIALAICRKIGGEFYKVSAEGEVKFTDYVGGIYEKEGEESGETSFARRYKGAYVCKGSSEEWTMSYRPSLGGGGIWHYSYLRKGIDQNLIAKEMETQKRTQGQSASVQNRDQLSEIALRAGMRKSPYVEQRGFMRYEGRYLGEQGGCSLVAVLVYNRDNLQATHNYRVCGGRVEYVGETGLPALPKGIESVRMDVAKMCQKYGTAQLNYEGTEISCRALRDKDNCLVELSYMQGSKLIQTETINACQK